MNLRNYKRILFFLNDLSSFIETPGSRKLTGKLINNYTDTELREIINWADNNAWSKNALAFMQRKELIKLISGDYDVLRWTIKHIEKQITNTSDCSQAEVDGFFKKAQNGLHYLASKPVNDWDEYDLSNYRSLLQKSGKAKKVYAIFTADVLAEDVYAVTTKPSYFFDTKEDAETEIQNIIKEEKFTESELKIHSLWLLT